jgi:starch phosphorylase
MPTRLPETLAASTRSGLTAEAIARDFVHNLFCRQAKFPEVATNNDLYLALAWTVRDRLLDRWIRSASAYREKSSRTVCYLSAEFLIGPQLGSNLLALGITEQTREAMCSLGLDLDALLEQEEEPGLGNGGLGRLAACFMDSLATLEIPAIGYGLHYEFGIFDQEIHDGWQVERTDRWLRYGYPWEVGRPEIEIPVGFGGRTEPYTDEKGRYRVRWLPDEVVLGVPYDTPVLGYGVQNANFLRLWSAVAPESFDLEAFNAGDYVKAVGDKIACENITKVLYPNDQGDAGKVLRLKQQYLLVSCSLKDMIRMFRQRDDDWAHFADKYAVQLNDTHPALAAPELMRLLMDEHGLGWDEAWTTATRAFGYTNHTLLPEALETWPLPLFASVLPRHLEIIYEINRRFLEEARRGPADEGRIARLSIIDERGEKRVRMANLACVASHTINGVAELHTQLLKTTVLSDFHAIWPDRFTNVTNGVTPRRFLALANPQLSRLITSAIGDKWVRDLDELRKLEELAEDSAFCDEWRKVKLENKRALAAKLERLGLPRIEPEALLDVQAKRIHEYKRQHLAALHAIAFYLRVLEERDEGSAPRTLLFAGKAAPGYKFAKLVIKLLHGIAEVVNADPKVGKRLKVVFAPDLTVKLGQSIYPAADLSEQISLAGWEASGTGNMKFAMNGALTIGTLDGANIEIRDAVGEDHFFLFGMTAGEAAEKKVRGYWPRDYFEKEPELREALELVSNGTFSRGDRALFEPLVRSLLERDEYMVLADFADYMACHVRVDDAWRNAERWTRSSILNVARVGKFSSDRAVREYCDRVWLAKPVPVSAAGEAPAPADQHSA